jgi:catechol 2,3-dioxygenase-like lactoylglutathione lyase family enzyme
MGIAVYFETLGLFFVSAAAALTVFFLCATRAFRSGEMRAAALAGVSGGFCYLAYYGSYLAFPLLGGFAVLAALSGRGREAGRVLLVSTAGILVVVAPFLAWDAASGDDYLRRFRQVALTTGTWSPYRRAVLDGASSASIAGRNLASSAEAFVRDGLGGSGGYTFGRLAPFDRFSLALLVAGALSALVLGLRRRESRELLLVLAVVGAAFLGGVALTIPPPAYHRFTVAFPFLAILMAVPFAGVARPSLSAPVRIAIPAGLLVLYASLNEARFLEAIARDRPVDDLLAVSLLRQRFSERDPIMALARYSDLDRTLYFYERPPRRPVVRGFHRWLLRDLDPGKKYAYVTAMPDRFETAFRRADPNGRMYRISWFFGIFAN